jgi:hypothetical protein
MAGGASIRVPYFSDSPAMRSKSAGLGEELLETARRSQNQRAGGIDARIPEPVRGSARQIDEIACPDDGCLLARGDLEDTVKQIESLVLPGVHSGGGPLPGGTDASSSPNAPPVDSTVALTVYVSPTTQVEGRTDFTEDEGEVAHELVSLLGQGFRAAGVRTRMSGSTSALWPGLIMLNEDRLVESITTPARKWLGELGFATDTALPFVLLNVAERVRTTGVDASACVLGASGDWIQVLASPATVGGS